MAFVPYDESTWLATLAKTEDVPPNIIRIQKIQCIIPKPGNGGGVGLLATVGALGAAVGAGIAAVIGTTVTVGTGGVGLPVAFALAAVLSIEGSAYGAAIGLAAQKIGTSIGSTFPDQAYITFDDEPVPVWPADGDFCRNE